jgi:hypothetical protein
VGCAVPPEVAKVIVIFRASRSCTSCLTPPLHQISIFSNENMLPKTPRKGTSIILCRKLSNDGRVGSGIKFPGSHSPSFRPVGRSIAVSISVQLGTIGLGLVGYKCYHIVIDDVL